MQKLFGLTAFVAVFALAACGGMPGSGDGGGGDGGGGMIDMYKNGTMKAMYWVAVHNDVAAGQMLEVTTTANYGGAESKTTSSWLCCKRDGDWAWIEQDSGAGYILAYKVDVTKGMGEANVAEAWIGKAGEKGEPVQVMEAPKPVEGGPTGEAPKVETTTGEETVNAGGKDWACTWVNHKTADMESKTWTSKEAGWTGVAVKQWSKMSAGESTTIVTKVATDAQPWLKWE